METQTDTQPQTDISEEIIEQTDLTTEETQTEITPEEWLKNEIDGIASPGDFERLPSLIFEENKTIEFDISKDDMPFQRWEDSVNKVTKKIIPVTHSGERKNLWLNVKNPLYKQILESLQKDITHFKVMQVGNQANTKYILVEN